MTYEGPVKVGLIELRAWALSSQNTAEREGFEGVAASIQPYLDWLNELHEHDVHAIRLVPVDLPDQRKPG